MAARTRNWKAMDAAHRRRGELITVVFDPDGRARIARADWPVPDYTTLRRREARLQVDLQAKMKPDRSRVLMVGSTGLKVFGEGA